MHPNIRLNNFVNIEDFEEIAKSNSSYIVVHKDLLNEFFFMRKNFPDNDFKQIAESIEKNREVYDTSYGLPAKTEAEKSMPPPGGAVNPGVSSNTPTPKQSDTSPPKNPTPGPENKSNKFQ